MLEWVGKGGKTGARERATDVRSSRDECVVLFGRPARDQPAVSKEEFLGRAPPGDQRVLFIQPLALERRFEMKTIIAIALTILAALVVLTLTPVNALPLGEECRISGIGTLGGDSQRDSFGGNVMPMKTGTLTGQWTHIAHDSEVIFHGEVHYVTCKRFETLSGPEVPAAYPNYANFGGTGEFNGEEGYFFDVRVFDHGEPGIYRDRYSIDIYDPGKVLVYHADGRITRDFHDCLEDPSVPSDLGWVLDLGCISGGNIQIHPPNEGHPF